MISVEFGQKRLRGDRTLRFECAAGRRYRIARFQPVGAVERGCDLESVCRTSRRDRCGATRRRLPSRRNRCWRLSWRGLSRRRLSRRRRLSWRRRLSRRRGLPRRIWRLGAAWLVPLGSGRRDRGRRCARRFGHRRSRRLCRPAARAGTVLVLYGPELSAGILGRLPVSQGLCGPAGASMLRPSRLGEALSNCRDDRPRRILSVSYRNSSLFARLRGDRSTRFIFVHRLAYGCEEKLFANLIEQSKSLQFVLHRIFEFGEA